MHEIPTGTPVFDWIVLKKWNIHDAYTNRKRMVGLGKIYLHVISNGAGVQSWTI